MSSRATQWAMGLVSVLVGLAVCVLIYRHPEALRAPAWVAYAAASAFVLAGLVVLAIASDAPRVQSYIAAAVLLCVLVICARVAFGPGKRACTMSFSFLHANVSDAICRGAFGIGALLVTLGLALLVCRAMRVEKGHSSVAEPRCDATPHVASFSASTRPFPGWRAFELKSNHLGAALPAPRFTSARPIRHAESTDRGAHECSNG